MSEYDVVVVGAGPAGLQFARTFREQSDYEVAVLERNDNLRDNDKSSGGSFPRAIEQFDLPDRTIQSLSEEVILDGPHASGVFPIANIVIDFPELLAFLGEEVRDLGGDILLGREVEGPILEDGHVVGVECTEGSGGEEFYADIVVDASGPDAVLGDPLGLVQLDKRTNGIGKEYEVVGEFPDKMVIDIDQSSSPGGYSWVFPVHDDAAKIGVCWVKDLHEEKSTEKEVRGNIDQYLADYMHGDDRWEVDHIREAHAGKVLTMGDAFDLRAANSFIAVGDAVASVSPIVGEGVRPGMESGEMAAEVAIEALDVGDTSREKLSEYETRWEDAKGQKWRNQQTITELMYNSNDGRQDVFIELASEFAQQQAHRVNDYNMTLEECMSEVSKIAPDKVISGLTDQEAMGD